VIAGGEVAHAAFRGVVGAMAMTGVRAFAVETGMLERPPPQQVAREAAPGLLRAAPDGSERAVEELVHWAVGALGGVGFAVLPAPLRRLPWAGPAYGLGIWLSFELVGAPLLGLSHHERHGAKARVALIADHTIYGLVLSELRERPRA
jgi:hypothetical protein